MSTSPRRLILAYLLATTGAISTFLPATAQQEALELHHIYGPDALHFSPQLPRIRWLPGGEEYLLGEEGDDGWSWAAVDAATGDAEPFYDPEPLAEALEEQLRLDGEDAASQARPASLRLSPDTDRLLLDLASDLFVWEFRRPRRWHPAHPRSGARGTRPLFARTAAVSPSSATRTCTSWTWEATSFA